MYLVFAANLAYSDKGVGQPSLYGDASRLPNACAHAPNTLPTSRLQRYTARSNRSGCRVIDSGRFSSNFSKPAPVDPNLKPFTIADDGELKEVNEGDLKDSDNDWDFSEFASPAPSQSNYEPEHDVSDDTGAYQFSRVDNDVIYVSG